MAGIDVSDKDPFAHADDEPKDNISFFGFIFSEIKISRNKVRPFT